MLFGPYNDALTIKQTFLDIKAKFRSLLLLSFI